MATVTKCDIIRDLIDANDNGNCRPYDQRLASAKKSRKNQDENNQKVIDSPNSTTEEKNIALAELNKPHTYALPDYPVCNTFGLVKVRGVYEQAQYNPMNFMTPESRQIRTGVMKAMQSAIASNEGILKKEYGNLAPVDIAWRDFGNCKWNKNGTPKTLMQQNGKSLDQIYIERYPYLNYNGYQPKPAIGIPWNYTPLSKKITRIIPTWMDSVFDPNVAVIALAVIFITIVIIIAITYAHLANLQRMRHRQKRQQPSV